MATYQTLRNHQGIAALLEDMIIPEVRKFTNEVLRVDGDVPIDVLDCLATAEVLLELAAQTIRGETMLTSGDVALIHATLETLAHDRLPDDYLPTAVVGGGDPRAEERMAAIRRLTEEAAA